MNTENAENKDAGAGEEQNLSASDLWAVRQKILVHFVRQRLLAGPGGSALLHVLILFVIFNVAVGTSNRDLSNYTVKLLNPETVDMPEEKKDIEKVDPEITPDRPDVDLPASDQLILGNPETGDPTSLGSGGGTGKDAGIGSGLGQELGFEVSVVRSPLVLRGMYATRTRGGIQGALEKYGGGRGGATEAAVMRALRWLKKNQNSDGSWNQNKCAMTGFALLTYLAHGETPASEEFGQTVEKAIRFLTDAQQGDGRFSPRDDHDYTHPIATYALCEAYGMTKVPMLKDAAEKALDVVIKGQHPNGGFNYNLNLNDINRNDSTYMSWCCQALKAGKMAGLSNSGLDEALKHSVDGWKVNLKGDASRATIGYISPGDSGLTGAATLCLQLLGAGNDPLAKGGMAALQATTYNWEGGGTYNCLYYWYYITQAMFHTGGEIWTRWNGVFAPVLVKNQIITPKAIADSNGEMVDIGHWAPAAGTSGHTDPEGKVMNTCLCTLQLEVYYRYLPTFKPPEEIEEAAAVLDKENNVNVEIR